MSSPFRDLPSVAQMLESPHLSDEPHAIAVKAVRQVLEEARAVIRSANGNGSSPEFNTLLARAVELVSLAQRPSLRRAINATGVLLHTNLGRATLCPAAAQAVQEVGYGHASLEVDEETGGRGSRQSHITRLLTELTDAEDAFVVNNNAAATFLAVTAITAGREVVLSRGQLVEIGGQFRLPDVIASAGAKLVEVGTTNRTRIGDYERAITDQTGMLLRVHPSNYKILGFTEDASLPELVALGKKTNIPVGDDIGSGALVDFSPYGLTDEPMAQTSIAAGADLVWFSGDKLLGGPQSGIVIGKSKYIAPLKKHPLSRALRPDKLTLTALQYTLAEYQRGTAWQEIPILNRVARPAEDILAACGRVARSLRSIAPDFDVDIVATQSEVGGGSLPGHTLPSWAVAITTDDVTTLARQLRQALIPVYGRIEKGRLLLDLRAVYETEELFIDEAFRQLAK